MTPLFLPTSPPVHDYHTGFLPFQTNHSLKQQTTLHLLILRFHSLYSMCTFRFWAYHCVMCWSSSNTSKHGATATFRVNEPCMKRQVLEWWYEGVGYGALYWEEAKARYVCLTVVVRGRSVFFNWFITQTVYTRCTKISFKIVPANKGQECKMWCYPKGRTYTLSYKCYTQNSHMGIVL